MISTKLQNHLDNAGVTYTRHPHALAYTSQEIAQRVHVPGREMLKSVMLKADENQLIMMVLSANDTVDLDALRREIGSRVVRLASETEFQDAFPTCKPGAMPPFGNIFNIPTYCEEDVSKNREVEFNAGTHDETIRMKFDDYQKAAMPLMFHFAHPHREGVQRLAS